MSQFGTGSGSGINESSLISELGSIGETKYLSQRDSLATASWSNNIVENSPDRQDLTAHFQRSLGKSSQRQVDIVQQANLEVEGAAQSIRGTAVSEGEGFVDGLKDKGNGFVEEAKESATEFYEEGKEKVVDAVDGAKEKAGDLVDEGKDTV